MDLGPLLPQYPMSMVISVLLFIAVVAVVVALLKFIVSKR